jgi:hypothetical protein
MDLTGLDFEVDAVAGGKRTEQFCQAAHGQ